MARFQADGKLPCERRGPPPETTCLDACAPRWNDSTWGTGWRPDRIAAPARLLGAWASGVASSAPVRWFHDALGGADVRSLVVSRVEHRDTRAAGLMEIVEVESRRVMTGQGPGLRSRCPPRYVAALGALEDVVELTCGLGECGDSGREVRQYDVDLGRCHAGRATVARHNCWRASEAARAWSMITASGGCWFVHRQPASALKGCVEARLRGPTPLGASRARCGEGIGSARRAQRRRRARDRDTRLGSGWVPYPKRQRRGVRNGQLPPRSPAPIDPTPSIAESRPMPRCWELPLGARCGPLESDPGASRCSPGLSGLTSIRNECGRWSERGHRRRGRSSRAIVRRASLGSTHQ